MLVNSIKLLQKARKEKYAVGAFNAYDMESAQAIIWAAEKLNKPSIIQVTPASLEFAGFDTLTEIIFDLVQKSKVSFAIHLDHGKDFAIVEKAINSGKFTSVMFDGSKLPFEKNVAVTKKITEIAHKKGIAVEAELGGIQSSDSFVSGADKYTDPQKAQEFIASTKCDSLAVAFGNVHGEKVKGEKLNFNALKSISEKVDVPLVFHGASNSTAAEFKKAIALGIAKINIDTQLRQAFQKTLKQTSKQKDPREVLASAREEMKEVVEDCIREFGTK